MEVTWLVGGRIGSAHSIRKDGLGKTACVSSSSAQNPQGLRGNSDTDQRLIGWFDNGAESRIINAFLEWRWQLPPI